MADVKISQLASAGVPETTAVLPIVSGGTTKKVSLGAIAEALGVDVSVVKTVNTTTPITGGPIFSTGSIGILEATPNGTRGTMSAADKAKLDAATPSNAASTLVIRGASGEFNGGVITGTSFVGPLTGAVTGNVVGNVTGNTNGVHTGSVIGAVTGNASTATTLLVSRSISTNGDITGTATNFDGSANIVIPTAITAGAIVDADVNASAAIAHSKLAAISTGQVLGGNAGVPTAMTISGDATLSSTGVLTLTADSVETAQITDANVTTPKIADANVTTAKIADANVTDAKLNTTGVAADSYGAAATNASVTIPYFTVNSKGRVTAAGEAAFPGKRVVNRVIYNDHITPSGVTPFGANPSLITLPGTYPLNQVGNQKNVIGVNYLDIFGGQLQAYTTQVSDSRVHFHFRFQATLYNGHAILSTRFKINNTIIAKIPVSVNGWPEFPVTWEYWYPVASAGTVLNLLFEGRSHTTNNMMRVHYARYWEGNDIANGTPNPPGYVYISPQIVITEWV